MAAKAAFTAAGGVLEEPAKKAAPKAAPTPAAAPAGEDAAAKKAAKEAEKEAKKEARKKGKQDAISTKSGGAPAPAGGAAPSPPQGASSWAALAQTAKTSARDVCAALDSYLASRTFLSGHQFGEADCVVSAALAEATKGLAHKDLAKDFPHVRRWLVQCTAMAPQGGERGPAGAEAPKKPSKYDNYKVELPGAEYGKVVTRFPPEPSGYMHLGHAKAAFLNEAMARKWGGKLILRFDDTNPEKEKGEFEESILADCKTLGIEFDMLTYTSDHFDMLLEKGKEILKLGKAYVDKTDAETMKTERDAGIPSKYRDNSIEENLRLFEEMYKGSEEGLQCCVRGKIDMSNNNKCLRDPMFWRCKPGCKHHRLGDKWKTCLFPGYDFACPIIDSVEGVTHAMRTLEYKDRQPMYYWVQEALSMRRVNMWEFSRLNMVNTCLSKRKLTQFVEKGITKGWDDPRMPTVRGILRRGMTVKGLREYIYSQGSSINDSLQEWDKIWALNKQIIDPVIPRYTAIASEEKAYCKLVVEGGEGMPAGVELKMRLFHPKDTKEGMTLERVETLVEAGLPAEGLGHKVVRFSKELLVETFDANSFEMGEEITLMEWGNAFVKRISKNGAGEVEEVAVELNLAGDFKKTKKKVTWLTAMKDLVPVELVELEHVVAVKKIEDGMDVLDHINPDSWITKYCFGDQNMRLVKKGDILQLNRKGYYVCDRPYISEAAPLILLQVPDGRQKKEKKEGGAKAGKEAPKKEAPKKDSKKEGGAKAGKEAPKKDAPKKDAPKKDAPKKKDSKKQVKEPTPEELAKAAAKKEKAAIKEGGKKGVEIEGACDMGGMQFFCTQLDEPDGDMSLLEKGFAAMNAEADPTEEERKGGAGNVGKVVFSAGSQALLMICNVPKDKLTDTPAKEEGAPPMKAVAADQWVKSILGKFAKDYPNAQINEGATSTFASASLPANEEKRLFPVKLKDDAMSYAYAYLNEHNCMPADDDSDDDYIPQGDFQMEDY